MLKSLSVGGLILAAGKGTRMKSPVPKVLHPVAGKPMISHVVDSLRRSGVSDICAVISQDAQFWDQYLRDNPTLSVCLQKDRNGTAGAVGSASACFAKASPVPYAPSESLGSRVYTGDHLIICAGDTPALDSQELSKFIQYCLDQSCDIGVLGMTVDEPYGYGRLIVDDQNQLLSIIEEKDANESQKSIRICNSGIIFAKIDVLFPLLRLLSAENSQNEYYLTDVIGVAHKQNFRVLAYLADHWQNFLGVNTPEQLQSIEKLIESKNRASSSHC